MSFVRLTFKTPDVLDSPELKTAARENAQRCEDPKEQEYAIEDELDRIKFFPYGENVTIEVDLHAMTAKVVERT